MKNNKHIRKELISVGPGLISTCILLLFSYSLVMASSLKDYEVINIINTPEDSVGCSPFTPGEITGNNSANPSCELTGYQWIRKEGNNSWESIEGGTEQDYEPESLEQTTHFRRIAFLNCNGTEKDDVADTSNIVTIRVYSESDGGIITPINTDVCSGSNSTLLTLQNHLGSVLKWQYQPEGQNGWIDIIHTANQYTANDITVKTIFRAEVQNGTCDPDSSKTAVIDVVESPTAYAGIDTAICENQVLICKADAGDYSALLWETTGDGNFSNSTLINPIYTPGSQDRLNGTVTLVFTASPILPCSDEAKDSLELTLQLLPSIEIATYDTICAGDTLFFDPLIVGQYEKIIWDHDGFGVFINPNSAEKGYVSVEDDAGKTITISLIVFAADLCSGTTVEKELYIYVHPSSSFEIEGQTSVCANLHNVIYNIDQEGFYNLLWTVVNGDIEGTDDTDEITVNWHNLPGQTGMIILQATDQATQCKSFSVDSVDFLQAAAVDPPEIVGKPVSNPVVLISNMYGIDTEGLSYNWYKDDVLIPGADQQFYYPINQTIVESGSAVFYVMITTDENCITKSETFGLDLKKTAEFPNNQFFRIYPNPAQEELNFELLPILYITGPAHYMVRIHDLSGRTVHQELINTDANRITGLNLPAGIYTVSLSSNGFRGIQKIVIIN